MTENGTVFVSYSHSDGERVQQVITALRARGWNIWFDEQLTPGLDWNDELARTIETCAFCIFFITEASVHSAVCERELTLAVRHGRNVLPVYLDDAELPPMLDLSIGNLQALRMQSASADALVEGLDAALQQRHAKAGRPDAHTATQAGHRPSRHATKVPTPSTHRQRLFWITGALLLVASVIYLIRSPVQTTPQSDAPRIAVLVFENFTGDRGNDYLGSGLAEELLDALAQFDALKVIPRTASFYYHDKDLPFPQIAAALDADLILEGSVLRRRGDDLRISAQLIDVATDAHLWSQTFDLALDELYDVKRSIGTSVAAELGQPAPEDTSSVDSAAYDLYLQGKERLRLNVTQEDRAAARSLFEAALRHQQNFVPALSGLCLTHLEEFVQSRAAQHYETAREVCERVLASSNQSVDALVALGTLDRLSGQIDDAVPLFERALQVDGAHEPALYGLSRCYEARGDFRAAERIAQSSIEAAPRYWKTYTAYAGFLYRQGRYRDAAAQSRRVTELFPDNPVGWSNLGTALFAAGNWSAADAAWQRSFDLQPTRHGYANLATLAHYRHDYDNARALLERGVERYPDDFRLLAKLGATYRALGMRDESLNMYRRAHTTTTGALAINPDDAVLLAHHGYICAALSLAADTQLAFDRANDLQPTNPEVAYLSAYAGVLLGTPWQDQLQRALDLGYSQRQADADPMFAQSDDAADPINSD